MHDIQAGGLSSGGCCDPPLDDVVDFDQALESLLVEARVVPGRETCGLFAAEGRVLAESVTSTIDVPDADNSAMDGYALRVADLDCCRLLKVSQRIPAGSCGRELGVGEAARIFTGAPIPPGADAVIMQEACAEKDGYLHIHGAVRPGDHVRRRGEAVAAGECVVAAGTRLRAQEIGVLAAVGVAEITVYRRVRVAILSTGDELIEPGSSLRPGQIYNSNRYQLHALCEESRCHVMDMGIVPDDFDRTVTALRKAADSADVLLSSGGVSVGEEDHLRAAIEHLGSIRMWRVRMKPGKPLAFGEVCGVPIIGLPGNPVAAFVGFHLFARPFLQRMAGMRGDDRASMRYPAGFDIENPRPRREFLRVRFDREGRLTPYHNQGSGVLPSVAWADGVAVIRENTTVKRGELLEFIDFG